MIDLRWYLSSRADSFYAYKIYTFVFQRKFLKFNPKILCLQSNSKAFSGIMTVLTSVMRAFNYSWLICDDATSNTCAFAAASLYTYTQKAHQSELCWRILRKFGVGCWLEHVCAMQCAIFILRSEFNSWFAPKWKMW